MDETKFEFGVDATYALIFEGSFVLKRPDDFFPILDIVFVILLSSTIELVSSGFERIKSL